MPRALSLVSLALLTLAGGPVVASPQDQFGGADTRARSPHETCRVPLRCDICRAPLRCDDAATTHSTTAPPGGGKRDGKPSERRQDASVSFSVSGQSQGELLCRVPERVPPEKRCPAAPHTHGFPTAFYW